VLHIEPLARPHVWQPFKLETQEADEDQQDAGE
jgi:diadenylate cyclase